MSILNRYNHQFLILCIVLAIQTLQICHILYSMSRSQSMVSQKLFVSLYIRDNKDISLRVKYSVRIMCLLVLIGHVMVINLWLLSDHFAYIHDSHHVNKYLLHIVCLMYLCLLCFSSLFKHVIVGRLFDICHFQLNLPSPDSYPAACGYSPPPVAIAAAASTATGAPSSDVSIELNRTSSAGKYSSASGGASSGLMMTMMTQQQQQQQQQHYLQRSACSNSDNEFYLKVVTLWHAYQRRHRGFSLNMVASGGTSGSGSGVDYSRRATGKTTTGDGSSWKPSKYSDYHNSLGATYVYLLLSLLSFLVDHSVCVRSEAYVRAA